MTTIVRALCTGAGMDNLSTNVSSEVLDNFTYGATLGVAAKTGNFSLGLGVNHTGSSHVDEFDVQANACFVCKALTIGNNHRCMSYF